MHLCLAGMYVSDELPAARMRARVRVRVVEQGRDLL